MSQTHNLNIHTYSFNEILNLFDLTYNIDLEGLKRAKKKVLMLHPDKSNLPPDYFLFYKKAFDIVMNYYQNNHKQNQEISSEKIKYQANNNNELNKGTTKKISSIINSMNSNEFQEKFNELFEKNMVQKSNTNKNDWFSKEEPIYEIDKNVSKSNMGIILENIKKQNQGLVRYEGVNNLYSSGNGTSLYDDLDENDDSHYVTSDPFSKLKFDDLRKVHKDQSIFAVSESDYNNVTKYNSIDQFNRARGQQDLTPLEKTHAEKIILEQERIFKEKMAQKQHQSYLKTQQYSEKNKSVLASFLQIENGNKKW